METVDEMDLRPFAAKHREDGKGAAAFEPGLMVSLLLYGYCLGERSSRRIGRLCETDVAFRVIAANLKPDHATIARFRRRHAAARDGLFTEILRLCREMGLVKMGVVALDGTKINANAALKANRTYEGLREEAEAKDREEDALYGDKRGDEMPEEEKRAGEKKRGRKPAKPDPAPEAEARANVTDPESRIMKTRRGYVQAYNAQAVVTREQIIVAAEVTQEANDVNRLAPMQDAGYWSDANGKVDGRKKTELLIATRKVWRRRNDIRESPPPRGRVPNSATAADLMERKLICGTHNLLKMWRHGDSRAVH